MTGYQFIFLLEQKNSHRSILPALCQFYFNFQQNTDADKQLCSGDGDDGSRAKPICVF